MYHIDTEDSITKTYYNTNYSYEEIEDVLGKIQTLVVNGKYIISLNDKRQENINFLEEYNIHNDKRKEIIMKIKVEDFCHSLQNMNIGYEYETLYVFVPQTQLFNSDGKEENVDIYVKFNLIDYASNSRVVIISFHKRNKPINYLFRK